MYPHPITQENFHSAWDYGCRKYLRARKASAIRSLSVPVCQLLFFLCFLVLTYGVIYDGFSGLPRSFLLKLPYGEDIWLQLSEILLMEALPGQLAGLLGLLYSLPLAAALLIWLLVLIFYHPAAPVLSQDPELHPRDLWTTAQQIGRDRSPRHSAALAFLSVLFGLMVAGGFTGFLFYYQNMPEIQQFLRQGMGQASLYFLLAWILLFFSYRLLNLPVKMVTSLLSYCPVSDRFYKDAETYYLRTGHESEQ